MAEAKSIDIGYSLPVVMQKILCHKDTFCIENDVDYYYLLDAIATSRTLHLKYTSRLEEEILRKNSVEELDFARSCLNEVAKYPSELEELRTKLLTETSFTPVFQRFLDHMEATPIEREIFEYIYFIFNSTTIKSMLQQIFQRYLYGGDGTPAAMSLCDIIDNCSLEDVLAFFAPTSRWVKQKIVSSLTSPHDSVPALSEGITGSK